MSSDVRDDKRAFYRDSAGNVVRQRSKVVTFNGNAVAAALTTALDGANNDLTITAVTAGKAGNDISIEYKAPTAPSQALSVDVNGKDIVVNLASGAGTNEVQTINVVATGGTFIIGYKDKFTQPIPYNATTAVVQAKLREVTGLETVVVTGVAGAWIVTFSGAGVAGLNVPALLIDGNRLTPAPRTVKAIVKEVTKGDDSPATNEVQSFALVNGLAGTFTITFDGQTTSAIAYNASAATIKSALEALSNIGVDEALVTGSGGKFQIEFDGTLGDSEQPLISVNVAGLRVASVAATTAGVDFAITSTAAQVDAAIDGKTEAAALVTPANAGGNDGSGVVTAMAKTYLTGGKNAVGDKDNANPPLFEAVGGDVRVAAVLSSRVVPVGASGTIIVGTPDDTDSLIPSFVATTATAGRTVDKSGLVTVGNAPVTAPHQLLKAGQQVTMTIGTADLTAGEFDVTLFYTPVTEGAFVRAL